MSDSPDTTWYSEARTDALPEPVDGVKMVVAFKSVPPADAPADAAAAGAGRRTAPSETPTPE